MSFANHLSLIGKRQFKDSTMNCPAYNSPRSTVTQKYFKPSNGTSLFAFDSARLQKPWIKKLLDAPIKPKRSRHETGTSIEPFALFEDEPSSIPQEDASSSTTFDSSPERYATPTKAERPPLKARPWTEQSPVKSEGDD